MSDEKRIIDQLEDTALSAGDYVIVDSQTEGTRKFDLGSELADVKQDLQDLQEEIEGGGSGLTDDAKQALLACFQNVAWVGNDGQDYYDDLYDALYAVQSISVSPSTLSFSIIDSTQQLTATTNPAGANVTWTSSDTSIATVSSNGLVTAKGYGTATITASAGGKTATCSVVVAQATLSSISCVYTQSGTVYESDSLDSLKTDLVVTAHWSNNTTSTVASADYTLSGTLTTGTSTITVTYSGKTTTFNVTVTSDPWVDMRGSMDTWTANAVNASITAGSDSVTIKNISSGVGWGINLLQSPLSHKTSDLQGGQARITFDAEVSGYTTGSGLVYGFASYNTQTPTSGNNRTKSKPDEFITTTGTYSFLMDITSENVDIASDKYLGVFMFLNANNGTTVALTNVSVEYNME